MSMLILDRDEAALVQAKRKALGLDRHDETWDGEVLIMPSPNNEHQQLAHRICYVIETVFGWASPHFISQAVNVTDQSFDWKVNHRSPDVVVFLHGNPAVNYDTYWHGGPEFLVEIISPDDRSRDKLPFYASVNTREVLIIDREPWTLELYQLQNGQLVNVGASNLAQPNVLPSSVLPVSFCLVAGTTRPGIEVTQVTTGQKWTL